MKLESIIRVHPLYTTDPRAIQMTTEDTAFSVVRNWLRGYPNSSLLLRRPQKVTKDVSSSGPDREFCIYQATATVIPIPQHNGELVLNHNDVFELVDDFYKKNRVNPNTLFLPPGFRYEVSGDWIQECRRASFDILKPSNDYITLFGELKVIDNAPMLAVALL